MLTPAADDLDLTEPLRHFAEHGYARLGPILDPAAAERLAAQATAPMQGQVVHPGLFFQHDSPTGRYEDLVFNAGWVGPSLAYRKLERLERDPLFWAWINNPLFERLARGVLGDDDAPAETGCLEVLPGSHLGGLATPEGGTVPDACLETAQAEARVQVLPARRGEAILVHNHTWHRTGRNTTAVPRRALSISFLSADVRCVRRRRAPRVFPTLFGGS